MRKFKAFLLVLSVITFYPLRGVADAVNQNTFTNRIVYTGSNVTTGAWTLISAALPYTVLSAFIFDSSGETLELGDGVSGHPRYLYITPGGGSYKLAISAGSPLYIRAVSANPAANAENTMNLFY